MIAPALADQGLDFLPVRFQPLKALDWLAGDHDTCDARAEIGPNFRQVV